MKFGRLIQTVHLSTQTPSNRVPEIRKSTYTNSMPKIWSSYSTTLIFVVIGMGASIFCSDYNNITKHCRNATFQVIIPQSADSSMSQQLSHMNTYPHRHTTSSVLCMKPGEKSQDVLLNYYCLTNTQCQKVVHHSILSS